MIKLRQGKTIFYLPFCFKESLMYFIFIIFVAVIGIISFQLISAIDLNTKTYSIHKRNSSRRFLITFEEFKENWIAIQFNNIEMKISENKDKILIDEHSYFDIHTIKFQDVFYCFNMIEYYKYHDWLVDVLENGIDSVRPRFWFKKENV